MRTSMSCAISRLCCFTFALSFCCTMRSRDIDSLSCILSFAYPSLAFPGCCCLEACRQTVQLKILEAPLCVYVCSCGAWRRRRCCLWWGVRGVMAAVHVRKVKLQVGLGTGRRRGTLGRGDTRPRFQRLGLPLHATTPVQRLSPSSLNPPKRHTRDTPTHFSVGLAGSPGKLELLGSRTQLRVILLGAIAHLASFKSSVIPFAFVQYTIHNTQPVYSQGLDIRIMADFCSCLCRP